MRYLLVMLIVAGMILLSGCERAGDKGGDSSDDEDMGSSVDVELSVGSEDTGPDDRISLDVLVRNGYVGSIYDVSGKVLSEPVNLEVDHEWRSISASLKSGGKKSVSWRFRVKSRDEFVMGADEEELKVRVKYRTSVRTFAKFSIGESEDDESNDKVVSELDLLPVRVEIDPARVGLSGGNEVSVEVTIEKEDKSGEKSGILGDELSRIRIEIPDLDDTFDLERSKCEYETDRVNLCSFSSDALSLESVKFYDGKIRIRLSLVLRNDNLDELAGQEKSVIVSLEDIWLYKDATTKIKYQV